MLWKYIHHLVIEAQYVSGEAFSILLPENFCKITWKEFMTWRLNNSTLSHSNKSPVGYRGQPKPDSNPNTQHLLNFKRSIKREVSQCTILKDEKYFKGFKNTLWAATTAPSCEEVMDVLLTSPHNGIPLYWSMHIQTPVVIKLGT